MNRCVNFLTCHWQFKNKWINLGYFVRLFYIEAKENIKPIKSAGLSINLLRIRTIRDSEKSII